ncbi:hypothetical protein [Rhodoflexus sp.]
MTKFRLFLLLLLLPLGIAAQKVRIADYYPLKPGTRWTYTPPPDKPDYISRIEQGETAGTVWHYDATNAAKILRYDRKKGILYSGEIFNDRSKVIFQEPFYWFAARQAKGDTLLVRTPYKKYETDGRITEGIFTLSQKIAGFEDVILSNGKQYLKCLRVDFNTHWTFADGRQAQSINVYHFAKNIGPVKASARFIIVSPEGKELINRLVETDLKKFEIGL